MQRKPADHRSYRARDRKSPGAMVLIDQAPLRRTVAQECATAMARLERARQGWHQYERQDRPAFIRWRAREFGALLSTAREVEDKIRDAQTLIYDVEIEMRRYFCDPFTAYRRVMARRGGENNIADEFDDDDASEAAYGATTTSSPPRKLTEFEQEALFHDWVQRFLGTNPDKMDDAAYSRSFEVFKSHMFFSSPAEEPARKEHSSPPPSAPIEEDESGPDSSMVDPRVKELYRRLVRRLHPDLRGDGNAAATGLWHEVQEAYAAGDVARMELLVALSDLSDRLGAGTTVSQMQSVLTELKRSVRALEKSLQEAQGEEAWNFARIGPSEDLRLRVDRQLKHDLSLREERLELLNRSIAEWARGRIQNPKIRAAVAGGWGSR